MAEHTHPVTDPNPRGTLTMEFVVLLPMNWVEVRIEPEPGVAIFGQVLVPTSTYHQAKHDKQRHVFDRLWKSASSTDVEMGVQIGPNVLPLLEPEAQALGAVRCTDCPWEG